MRTHPRRNGTRHRGPPRWIARLLCGGCLLWPVPLFAGPQQAHQTTAVRAPAGSARRHHVELGASLWQATATREGGVVLLPMGPHGSLPMALTQVEQRVAERLTKDPQIPWEGGAQAPRRLRAGLEDADLACLREVTCAAELAEALGARYALLGDTSSEGANETFVFQLVDARAAIVVHRGSWRVGEAMAPPDDAAYFAARLSLSPLLHEGDGRLQVRGAGQRRMEVWVDGILSELSPVDEVVVKGGPHRVELRDEKGDAAVYFVEVPRDAAVLLDLEASDLYRAADTAQRGSGALAGWLHMTGGAVVFGAGAAALVVSSLEAATINAEIRDANAQGGVTAVQKAVLDDRTGWVHTLTGFGIGALCVGTAWGIYGGLTLTE